jgi:glutaminyl-tRNA synthetase
MSDPTAARENKTPETGPGNFVEELVASDVQQGLHGGRVMTRFPPEPNGYLHIGHAKSICLNFGLVKRLSDAGAGDFKCNLRFDDTNPEVEEVEYVESIKNDVKWLGFGWEDRLYFASDYFGKLYDFAEKMIQDGTAYVDSQSLEDIREGRGDFYKPGKESPFRDRTPDENLDLFRRMRAGEFPDGKHVLRAKGDMTSTDVKMRDPVMVRIRHAKHHRTGDAWCIYPMYDWAHGQSDFIEGVTHSICTLEFQNHRPLYNWFLDRVGAPENARPKQIEFARLNLSFTVLSKRRLQELVAGKHVTGWDDPRMPTLAGLRRRGVTSTAIRAFCERIGVSTRDGVVDVTLLEHAIREDLNATSPRVMAVVDPLKVVIENFDEDKVEELVAPFDPEKPDGPSRKVLLTRELYIEREDFQEVAPKKWFRLAPGQEVRLRYGCLIKCTSVVKDAAGNITELRCTWDPDSLGGTPKDGRKVKGTLHWVPAKQAIDIEVRLYDRLFSVEDPMQDKDAYLKHLNPKSLEVKRGKLEPAMTALKPGDRVQFERLGYFCVDLDSKPDAVVFNRTISLKDSWAPQKG